MFCLPREYYEKIKQAIRSGKFDIEKLMTDSQARRDMLSEIVGKENAEQVSTLIEKKLLLKNTEKGIYDAIREVTGLSTKEKEALSLKTKERFAERNRRIYDPKENEAFLNEITSDIYSKKYKTEVSLEEAQTITELAQDMKVAKEELLKSGKKGFGAAKVALDNYVNGIRIETIKRGFINPFREVGIGAKLKAIVEDAKVSVNFIAENSRAIVASMDNSLWFRQGMKVLMDPRYSVTWIKDFAKSWIDIYKTIRGKIGKGATAGEVFFGKDAIRAGDAVTDGVKANAYERQNFTNGRYEGKAGDGPRGTRLDIGTGEEAYPTSKPSLIPILGRFFKGAEVAYEAGAMRLRMDIADKVYAWAEKSGYDMTNNQVIGELNYTINQMTGRGSFGARAGGFEKAANKAFFSIKLFKSNVDYLVSPIKLLGDIHSPGRRLAATNLLYTVATTGLIMGIAKVLNPNDNKDIFNPNSSNFCKIRNGNMTFDMSHGAGGIVVAINKIVTQKTTSSTTGITTKLGEGYGSQTGMDILWNFTENKFSPMFSVIKDIIKQQTFEGKKPTIISEVGSLTTPISIQNISQFKGEPTTMQIIGLVADALGISVNVFSAKTDWSQSTSKEMTQFKTKIGEDKFKQENDNFNKQVNEYLKSEAYKKLSNEEKQTQLTKQRDKIKSRIFIKYGFKPKY